jgi:SNF2 family DNA or RNA helicase
LNYQEFIESKKHRGENFGISVNCKIDKMFDFQKYVSEYLVKKGRAAAFLDTGLGKTVIELFIADCYRRHTNKPVLILTPLAVAFQFIKEAEKFNFDGVEYSKNGKHSKGIVIANYERLHYFDSNDFDCVILDESSILKNFEGETKKHITEFIKKVKYRYLFTATPSPNDYTELGTSSEALGYLGYTDMLGRFFKNNQNNAVKNSRVEMANAGNEWYLKPHAEDGFWDWIMSWSISMKKPSDHGFSDSKHVLPNLNESYSVVKNMAPLCANNQMSLFNFPANSFSEIKAEVRQTINQRCEKAVECLSSCDIGVYWVNLNDESKLIADIDDSAVEIEGKMSIEQKEEILNDFSNSKIKRLITKTSITCFGLNWQHCNNTSYFPTYSYEQYYQAIRRFWRFGQQKPVNVNIVLSDGQEKIMNSLFIKKTKAERMYQKLVDKTCGKYILTNNSFDKNIIKPNF